MTPPRASHPALLLAGLAGLVAFAFLYRVANPQAAVTLRVSRTQAVDTAERFLAEQGAPLADLKRAVQFEGTTVGLVFLQRSVGLAEASRWAREEVPIWSWKARWFQPEQKEEWQVRVGVGGAVAGFAHLVDEAAPGADLPQDSALALAQDFLRRRGWDLAAFERVEASSTKRDKRADHHFAWDKRAPRVSWLGTAGATGTGTVRLTVDVQGDRVGGYRHFLKVPEAFQRGLEQTLSLGQLLAVASLAATFVLLVIALALAIARQRKGDVRWGPSLRLAGLITLLFVVQGMALWPRLKFAYPTEIRWDAYVGVAVIGLLIAAVLYGAWALFATAAGESLAREAFPRSLAGFLEAAHGRLLTPAVARASLDGTALGFFFLGYLVVFYVIAQRYFGAWLPAEGPYSEIFNSGIPFLAPLTISAVAAVTEETTYRLFGISLFKRYAKSTAVALLVPAAIWAFGHSSYAVFPVYLRGIELIIGGTVLGLAFIRLGLLACIFAHYLVDAVLIGIPLLSAGNPAYTVSGLVVMGLALLPAALGLVARRADTATASPGL
ncbi:MAG: CPBP family intramembrane metalloprotease [Gemmatimonadetes bacterium]|nr:CPBP family intramembrane metalloprotease [Gemmatimonadota bacterium]